MARRTSRHDLIDLVPLIMGLILLSILLVPGGLYLLSATNVIFLNLASFTILVIAGFVVYRLPTRSRTRGLNPVTEILQHENRIEIHHPQPTTPELLGRIRKIDWYQFEKIVAIVSQGLAETCREALSPNLTDDAVTKTRQRLGLRVFRRRKIQVKSTGNGLHFSRNWT
jgi:hypothetical protein